MNVEKQIFYNTEQIKELYEKKKKAVGCFEANRRYGGVRFSLRRRSSITLEAEFLSLGGSGSFFLDGLCLGVSAKPFFHAEVILDKGEHLFDTDFPVTHGGFRISAEGAGLLEGEGYADRVGGCSSGSDAVVYLKNGDRALTRYAYTSGNLSQSDTSLLLCDHAYRYDRTGSAYTSDLRSVSAVNHSGITVQNGMEQTISVTGLTSAAICDARTLETGADYLVAYTNASGALHLLRTVEGGSYQAASDITAASGIRRVLSAQRGSILLLEDKEGAWQGWFFRANGAKTLTFTGCTLHYDSITLGKTFSTPTATIKQSDGTPIFYYRKEDGRLMRLAFGGSSTAVAYADAYHPVAGGGLLQSSGSIAYYAL